MKFQNAVLLTAALAAQQAAAAPKPNYGDVAPSHGATVTVTAQVTKTVSRVATVTVTAPCQPGGGSAGGKPGSGNSQGSGGSTSGGQQGAQQGGSGSGGQGGVSVGGGVSIGGISVGGGAVTGGNGHGQAGVSSGSGTGSGPGYGGGYSGCTPQTGLEYIAQHNPFPLNWDTDKSYTQLDPNFFKTAPAIQQSMTPYYTCQTYFSASAAFTLYDRGSPIPQNELVVQQRGYLYSEKGGKYSVRIMSGNDNAFLWWEGPNAINYTRQNVGHMSVLYTNPADTVFTVTVEPGVPYPIRFMGANEEGPGALGIDILDPEGKKCFCRGGAPVESNPECFYREVCAPSPHGVFKPWGQEA